MYVTASDGLQLHVRRAGSPSDRCPVLLVHGFTGGVGAWPARVIDGLARDRLVCVVDLPGHGRSGVPDRADRFGIEHIVGDLCGILDAIGTDQADWVGYSMGGRVALAGGVLQQKRVHRLVLESTSPGLEAEADREARRAADGELATRIRAQPMERFVDEWMAQPLFASQRALGAQWLDKERKRRLALAPEAMALCLEGLGTGRQPSFWGRLSAVDAPTLLLTGALDPKFTRIARDMRERMPTAGHVEVASAGHCVHAEAPVAWLEQVRRFLDGTAESDAVVTRAGSPEGG